MTIEQARLWRLWSYKQEFLQDCMKFNSDVKDVGLQKGYVRFVFHNKPHPMRIPLESFETFGEFRAIARVMLAMEK
jgi:hypothetical protein